jgi:hypothetical protein
MADKAIDNRGESSATVVVPEIPDNAGTDGFDAIFEEAAAKEGQADITAADDPNNVKAGAAGNEPPVTVIPAEPVQPAETPPVIAQKPGESDETYEQRWRTLQGIHKHDKESWDAEKTKLLSDLEEAKKPKAPGAPAPTPTKEETAAAEAFIDSLTPEQKEQLANYEQDFDVVSKMEGIKRNIELAKLRKEIESWKTDILSKFTAQETQINSQIAPAVALVAENEREAHFDAIRQGYAREDGTIVTGHPDFEKYRDDGSLLKWIDSKPKYLQPALKETYSKGTAMDVIDLFSDFKRENNIPETIQPSDNVIQMNARKAEKKKALTTVTSRHGSVNLNKPVSDDFDGAFDEASIK